MKKRLKFILVMIIIMSFFTACTHKEDTEELLAVVVGNHANAPDIPLNAETIKEEIYKSCYTQGSVSFVTADGNPKVYYQADIPRLNIKGLTEAKKVGIAKAYTSQLLLELSKSIPQVPEVDTLKAIRQAAKTLAGNKEGTDKVIVIMDSGLSTTGYLNFAKGVLCADIKSVVDALIKEEAIPDLTGISVIWMFNGQTAEPQMELSERQKHKLQEVWESILLEGGVQDIQFVEDIASDVSDNRYPSVSVVDVDEITTNLEKPVETIVFDNISVQFIGDKAEFVNYDVANESISKCAELLITHPNNKVYVIGTTASGEKEFCDELSNNRAEVVIQALVGYGVPEEQLIPKGLGYENPWHIDDIDIYGHHIEKYASQNRKVLIVDVNGDDAKKLN